MDKSSSFATSSVPIPAPFHYDPVKLLITKEVTISYLDIIPLLKPDVTHDFLISIVDSNNGKEFRAPKSQDAAFSFSRINPKTGIRVV